MDGADTQPVPILVYNTENKNCVPATVCDIDNRNFSTCQSDYNSLNEACNDAEMKTKESTPLSQKPEGTAQSELFIVAGSGQARSKHYENCVLDQYQNAAEPSAHNCRQSTILTDNVPPSAVTVARSLRAREHKYIGHDPPQNNVKLKAKICRKIRNANYSDSEIKCLLKCVSQRVDALWSPGTTPADFIAKQVCWDEIAEEVNKCSRKGVYRSGKEVRKKFSKLKMAVLGYERGEYYGKVDTHMISMVNEILNSASAVSANSSLETADGTCGKLLMVNNSDSIDNQDARISTDTDETTVDGYTGHSLNSDSASQTGSFTAEGGAPSDSVNLQTLDKQKVFSLSGSARGGSTLTNDLYPKLRQAAVENDNANSRKSPSPRKLQPMSKKHKKHLRTPVTNRVANFSQSELETVLDVCEANKEEFFTRGLFVRKRNLTTSKLRAWQLITDAVNKQHSMKTGIKRKLREVRKKVLKMRSAARKTQEALNASLRNGKKVPAVERNIHRLMQLMEAEVSHRHPPVPADLNQSGPTPDNDWSRNDGGLKLKEELTVAATEGGTANRLSSRTGELVQKHLETVAQTCQKLRKLGVDINAVLLSPNGATTCGSNRLRVLPPQTLPWASVTIQAHKDPKRCQQLEPRIFSDQWRSTPFGPSCHQTSNSKSSNRTATRQPPEPADPREKRLPSEGLDLPLKTEHDTDVDASAADTDVDEEGAESGNLDGCSEDSDSNDLNVVFACDEEKIALDGSLSLEHFPLPQLENTGAEPPSNNNCLLCLKTFSTPMGLSIHSRRVHNVRRKDQHLVVPPAILTMPHSTKKGMFPCEICGKMFAWKKSLKQHKFVHDKNKRFQCEICGREFTYKYNMSLHMRVHKDVRPSQCEFCDKSFHMSSTLKVHIRRKHTGERPYLCDLCGQSFFTKTIMTNHRRTHTGETPFICMVCGESFKHRSALSFHQHSHTNDQPNVCTYCGKAFRTSYKLKVHLRMHTGEKPYTCEVCNEKFARSDTLKQHTKNRHPDIIGCLMQAAAVAASLYPQK